MATKCPPVNRLFAVPRKAAIETLAEEYLHKTRRNLFPKRISKKNSKYTKQKSGEYKISNQFISPTKPTSGPSKNSLEKNPLNEQAFVVIMENNNKSRIIMKKGQTLRDILESICIKRGLDINQYIVKETASGNILSLETLLSDVDGLSVNFVKKDEIQE